MESIKERALRLYRKYKSYNNINYDQIPSLVLNELNIYNNDDLDKVVKVFMEIYKNNKEVVTYLKRYSNKSIMGNGLNG